MHIFTTARWISSAILLGLLLLCPTAVFAQDSETEKVEISEEQQTLNDEGVRAMIKGDYAGAVALLERSIRMGENNVTYLNLGRAYQKLGNCAEAREALTMAKQAQPVADPSEQEVNERADEFLSALDDQCTGQPENGGSEPEPATSSPSSSGGPWGWVTAGAGVALIGAGVGLHFAAEGTRQKVRDETVAGNDGVVRDGMSQERAYTLQDRANTTDTIGLGMGIAGGVLAAFGTYLIISQRGAETRSTTLSINPGPNGLSVSIGGRF